jgi:hypothetical protein
MTYAPDRAVAPVVPSGRRIAVATLVAVAVAAIILVTAVLPAEYGIDPLGTGRALGLLDLAPGRSDVLAPEAADFKVDSVTFVLGPFESVEYKYRIGQRGSLVYAWKATGELLYDFHAEPDGAPEGYAESFDQSRASEQRGTYRAPFSGIHGWFWENRGTSDVTVRLTTAGFYTGAIEFRGNDQAPREVKDLTHLEDSLRDTP